MPRRQRKRKPAALPANPGAQCQFVNSTERYPALIGGHGSGKTWGGSAKLLGDHIKYPGTDSLGVEPTYQNLRQIMLPAIRERLTELQVPHSINLTHMEIHTPSLHSKILLHSGLNAERITGFEVGRAWIDEPARVPEFRDPKRNLWVACIARVRDERVPIEERRVSATGTHEGKGTWFYRKWEQDAKVGYTVYRAATTDNPSAVEQAALYLEEYGPELAQQYVYGLAVDDSMAAIEWETLAACQSSSAQIGDLEALRHLSGPLYAGVDIGRTKSLTVIWVVRREGDKLRTVAVVEMKRATFAEQERAIGTVCRHKGLVRIAIDATYNPQTAEDACREYGEVDTYQNGLVEPVVFTQAVKLAVFQGWIKACQNGWLLIPVSDDILLDFYSVKRVVSSGGVVSYVAPYTADGHADRASAASLCVWAARGEEAGPMDVAYGPALRSRDLSRL